MSRCVICKSEEKGAFQCKASLDYGTVYDVLECPSCGGFYFDPLPSLNELENFYSPSYYDFERHKNEGRGMAFARKYLRYKKTGKFLDIGCATGFFINGIKNNSDWEVYGVEFGAAAAKFAQENLGLNVKQGEVMSASFPEHYFDFVHVNNVLEHVLDPPAFLRECRRILKPDGIMYLSVPNGFVDSRDLITFYKSENRPARSKNGHIFFFPKHTLLRMLDETGFIIEKSHTYGIRRGFRSLGLFPRRGKWKRPYFPREEAAGDQESVKTVHKPKHSDFYYLYRFTQLNLKMIPGLIPVGLDFQLILKPAGK